MPPGRRPLLSPRLENAAVERVQITEIELPAGEPTGLHLHPIPVVGYVVAGEIQFQVEGQAPRTLSAGQAFYEPAGRRILHFDNTSLVESAKFAAIYLQGTGETVLIRMLEA